MNCPHCQTHLTKVVLDLEATRTASVTPSGHIVSPEGVDNVQITGAACHVCLKLLNIDNFILPGDF